MKDFDLILFDMDGTLYPNCDEMNFAYPEAALEVITKATGYTQDQARKDFQEKWDRMAEEIGGRPTNTRVVLAYYEVSFEEYALAVDRRLAIEKYVERDPRVIDAVQRISEIYPIHLFTTNNGLTAEKILIHLGLDTLFPPERRFSVSTIGKMDLSRQEKIQTIKPGRRGFQHLMEMHGSGPEHTLMVGDSLVSDIQPAEDLGLATYQIHSMADLYRLPAWLEIDDPGDEVRHG